MSRGLAMWRAIARTPLSPFAAIIMIVGLVGGSYLVMTHGYRLLLQWKDGRFELAPADPHSEQSARGD